VSGYERQLFALFKNFLAVIMSQSLVKEIGVKIVAYDPICRALFDKRKKIDKRSNS